MVFVCKWDSTRAWWSCLYMLHSSGTPRGWLCISTGMVSRVVMCKEKKHLFPGTIFGIQTLNILKELYHILKSFCLKNSIWIKEDISGFPQVWGKNSPRSGKSQGILFWFRGYWHVEQSVGEIEIMQHRWFKTIEDRKKYLWLLLSQQSFTSIKKEKNICWKLISLNEWV